MRRIATCLSFALLVPTLAACSIIQPPINLTVTQVDESPKSAPRDFKTMLLTVSNPSGGIARGVTVRDTLPTGFSYVSTKTVGGDAIRTRTQDPPINTPVPTFGSWSIPVGTAKKPSLLTIEFVVAVGASPGKAPNFVEVAADDADPAAATPMVLSVQPTALVDLQVSARSPASPGGSVHYSILVRNSGTAAARSTFLSAALPGGFVYTGTTQRSGNSFRQSVTEPLPSSLLPSWGTWAVPPRQEGGSPGTLQVSFDAKVAPDELPGNYGISVTLTYNNLPAQTVSDQAVVVVVRK
ncbi:MAG TPA: hypothetical protein VGR61_10890 [Candidatus Dormibacteraeota bacterium]|nr:hypothetical protein [Candidatus Dormibacteraeota bacterium]